MNVFYKYTSTNYSNILFDYKYDTYIDTVLSVKLTKEFDETKTK